MTSGFFLYLNTYNSKKAACYQNKIKILNPCDCSKAQTLETPSMNVKQNIITPSLLL